ncbi:MAG: hypothetical protein CO030_03600 [Candidatus Magasanikbacteria bacterium CG_4_9_14_0_2_um_filter_42_11]|uniref:Cell envelope-related transcriptional attenuator domain-containing protein n=1 Tax=Candidatus Magasanikbacteria bacterium CG_4_9_14_0_2_um_filter_42_11 TaxID=1974643 RepID=A0A2M8F982_9BACT|nr:MAG: hypothetical protein COU34_01510 [Candidatus Magasanikbacteria bacterium CG10_big_fil_rev_8_21_14_0_10_43_9]PIY92577.1 MAG: hypothetical protein COY70_02500 [Candidatus Magasanikbacteria bacterium CG_4_10_14_0_8_um_filter_42_12]PJC52300.1 MAG: hypothetical protein CO030_03600 [Candidatus Magasanikbacteria bacterium CG_4_9_14_0_2_um_filter_42_11]
MTRTSRLLWRIFLFVLFCIGFAFLVYGYDWYQESREVREEHARQQAAIYAVISDRQADDLDETGDPFEEDGIVRVLFIGLDSRAGQEFGHCDAIQLIEIDKKNESVNITAVPRGTYAPLPFGKGVTSTDYYVSNSCALGGLEYGITNIERILGKKADYLVMVGFSETFGILRRMELPTTETLQWLRNRQGYAIGEPQRARNHSTFIKQMMVKFVPEDASAIDTAFHYLIYKMVRTDLRFGEAEEIVKVLSAMNIQEHPEKISLSMKPAYTVQDIPYDPDTISEHLSSTLGKISQWLPKADYSGQSEEDIQGKLLATIAEHDGDEEFFKWAFENDLWLQIEDDTTREQMRWDMMNTYFTLITVQEKQNLLADYVLEMEQLGKSEWEEKGKALLLTWIEDTQR